MTTFQPSGEKTNGWTTAAYVSGSISFFVAVHVIHLKHQVPSNEGETRHTQSYAAIRPSACVNEPAVISK